MQKTYLTHHQRSERLPRHRHTESYVAVVLQGGYSEAGDRGRFRVLAGQALVHRSFESHKNVFSDSSVTVLNLPVCQNAKLPSGSLVAPCGSVVDPDALVRKAAKDVREAFDLFCESFCPMDLSERDWPDLLATELCSRQELELAGWAAKLGIAPQSLSRGFLQLYGVSPKRFRLEQRTLSAIQMLTSSTTPLAQLSVDAGFADQAHLSRSVQALAGFSPRALRVQSVQALSQRSSIK